MGLTFRGSARVKIVTRGMYVTAAKDPTTQVLKYKLRNQFCWMDPALTKKSQKQSSERSENPALIGAFQRSDSGPRGDG